MYSEVIVLLGKEEYENIPGQGRKKKQKRREIFAKLLNVGMKEFYESHSYGLQPELKFEIADYEDYQNEKELIYNNTKYQVLRTYKKGNRLEITVYGGIQSATS